MNPEKIKKIIQILKKEYPNARTCLYHGNALDLLVATILSAQCTDERVNRVTKVLFKKFKKAEDYAKVKQNVLEKYIFSTGFYKNKAKNIIAMATYLVKQHGGKVPDSMEELVKIPGVGRKTANVVLSEYFGKNAGIVVDTHVVRLSQLLGLTKNKDATRIEKDLMKIVPEKYWGEFSMMLILHGRNVCIANRPKCKECKLNKLCPSAKI